MLEKVISVAGPINSLLVFAVGIIGAYQQTVFVNEWIEDHAKSKDFFVQGLLSAMAIFSTSLSDRCRYRRRRLLMWICAFFALLVVQILLVWGARSL